MTSVSELFYQRRSRYGRNSEPLTHGSGLDSPPPDRTSRRQRNYNGIGGNQTRRNRPDPDGCDPLRRVTLHSRQPPHYRPSHPPQERGPGRLEEGGHHHSLGNTSHSETHVNVQDRLGFSGNDRLPGPVLLARERLVQRLRGVTLSGSRRTNRSQPSSHRNDNAIGDDFRLVDAGDWETEVTRDWPAIFIPLTHSVGRHPSKRPQGLTEEALGRLPVEKFYISGDSNDEKTCKASRECSICLESFSEGDELIRLPCNHRYHFCCLEPWVRTCGDCPYCRRAIDVTNSD